MTLPLLRKMPAESFVHPNEDSCPICLDIVSSEENKGKEIFAHDLTIENNVKQCWIHSSCFLTSLEQIKRGDQKNGEGDLTIRCIGCQNKVTLALNDIPSSIVQARTIGEAIQTIKTIATAVVVGVTAGITTGTTAVVVGGTIARVMGRNPGRDLGRVLGLGAGAGTAVIVARNAIREELGTGIAAIIIIAGAMGGIMGGEEGIRRVISRT